MRKQLLSLAAVAALAMVGIGATATSAQAAPQAIKISEILIDTNVNADPTGALISGVEVVKPSTASIQNYKIQACNSAGTLSTIATISNTETGQPRTAASDAAGYEYTFDAGATMDPNGGVRLIDNNGNVVDAVTFNPTNTAVTTCLNVTNPDVALAPTAISSPQRADEASGSNDTGAFVAGAPTFPTSRGAENLV